jgi:uncharacterized protein YraI
MKKLKLIGAIAGLTLFGVSSAGATPGFSTANVNVRTGPDIDFPSVGVIPEGDPVEIAGCLEDESWCDVIWAGDRGWVYSEYLAFEDGSGEFVALPDVGLAAYRIPVITFYAGDYWDRYYRGRPWYRDRARWVDYRWRARPGWHAPPPGPRRRGWWRAGYRAPHGMGPPPDRWHRRHERHERRDEWRDDRRDFRRGDRHDHHGRH